MKIIIEINLDKIPASNPAEELSKILQTVARHVASVRPDKMNIFHNENVVGEFKVLKEDNI